MRFPETPVAQPAGKQLALLYYLASRRRSVTKEELAELLWNGKRNNLRVALHRLRSLPGAGEWLIDGAEVGVRCDTDFEQFELLLDLGEYGRALAVWQDSHVDGWARTALLEGFQVRNAPVFDDWLEIERRRTEGLYFECLQKHASELGKDGRYDEALHLWRRLLSEDPLHEGAHREVIQLEWLRGEPKAALAQFEACRRVLSEELGLQPLEETLELYAKVRSSLDSAAATSDRPATAAPLEAAVPFVGREKELAMAEELLAQRRLLTLTGPGGAGKTRLAQRAATILSDRFAFGYRAVYLAQLSSADFMVPALGTAVGLTFTAGTTPKVQLLDYFRDKEMLLLVDNLEHLLAGAELLHELLEQAPGLRVVATSREPLDLPGEAVLPIAGLSYPGPFDEAQAEQYEAVRLLVLHAHRAHVGFRLSGENAAHAARICRLVEGLPLALELAGSWVRQMPLEELADDLAENLDALRRADDGATDGDRANADGELDGRRHSMRAALDHSWQLLTDGEREALARLSVFRGGFDRDAAARAAEVDLRTLLALVNKSLLVRSARGRFGMLELIRHFAEEKLATFPNYCGETREAHTAHFASLVASAEPALLGADQLKALERLAAEAENVRLAWRSAGKHGSVHHLTQMLDGLFLYERTAGLPQRGERLLAEAGRAISARPERLEGAGRLLERIAARRGVLLVEVGEYQQAEQLLGAGLEAARSVDDSAEIGFCLAGMAEGALRSGDAEEAELVALAALEGKGIRASDACSALLTLGAAEGTRGHLERARDSFERALQGYRELGNRAGLLKAFNSLGVVAGTSGEFEKARRYFGDSLEMATELGDRHGAANALGNLGMAALILEDRTEARGRFEQSLAIRRELGSRPGLVDCLTDLGTLELESGRMEEAKEYFRQAVELARPLDNPQKLALALSNLGLTLALSGDATVGHRNLVEALDLEFAAGLLPAAMATMASFAQLFVRAGRPQLAALVFAFILGQPETTAETRMVGEEHLAGLGHLGDQLESARTQASQMMIEEVARLLREPL